jgi:DNA-binding CsgD family transcriptional regulator
MRSKSSPTRRVSTSTDKAISALHEEFIRGFREESAAVASEFRERVSPILGTLGAAYVLGLRPGRWKWSGVYFNEPASWRKGCWECLDHLCSTFPGRLKVFVADLCELGHSVDTVAKELEDICVLISNGESRNWLACFCGDGTPAPDWRAPGWLLDWPDELEAGALPATTSNGRLDDDQTCGVCEKIQDYVAESLAPAKEAALNHALILIAKGNSRTRREQTGVASQQEQASELPAKKADYSSHFDAANLTDKQREAVSLCLEYGMSVPEIARRLGKNRKTVDEHLTAARKKIDYARAGEKRAKQRAKVNLET